MTVSKKKVVKKTRPSTTSAAKKSRKKSTTKKIQKVRKAAKVVERSQALWARAGKVSTPVSGGVGFVGDFLEPLMDICTPVFYSSAGVCALWFMVHKPKIDVLLAADKITEEEYEEKKADNWVLAILAYSFIATIVSGSIHFLQSHFSKDNKGIAASLVPQVADYQSRILKLEKEVKQVKERVKKVEKRVGKVENRVDVVEDDVQNLNRKVNKYVKNPKNASDYFINFWFHLKKSNFKESNDYLVKLFKAPDRKIDQTIWAVRFFYDTFDEESLEILGDLLKQYPKDLYLKYFYCTTLNTCRRKQIQNELKEIIKNDESNIEALIIMQQSLLLWGSIGYKISVNRGNNGAPGFNTHYSFQLYEEYQPLFKKYLSRKNINSQTEKSKRQGMMISSINSLKKRFRKYMKDPSYRLRVELERKIRNYSSGKYISETLRFGPGVGDFIFASYQIDGGPVVEFPAVKNRRGFIEAKTRLYFTNNDNNLLGEFKEITFKYTDGDGYRFKDTYNYKDILKLIND